MTSRRAIVAALALVVIAVVVWRMGRADPRAAAAGAVAGGSAGLQVANSGHKPAAEEGERSPLADSLGSPATDIRADLRVMADIIETFRTNFPRDGNPVGNNAEITAALTGRNKLRLALIPPDHPAISRAGELCDRWGTPFFFHAESATRMEIRSAGPDRKMWTDDDVVSTP